MAGEGRTKLTIMQAKWLDAYIETGNATEAAKRAGYRCKHENGFQVIGCENLSKLKPTVTEIMDGMGLTMPRLIRKLEEGLDAESVVTANYQGQITDERTYTDYPTRRAYLDMAMKLRGAYAPEKQELSGPGGGPIPFEESLRKIYGDRVDKP